MTDISRRKLFGAAGAASLGLAGMVPVASASECGKPVKWNETKEFVIIGTGFAGLAAALEAHQGGMKADQILILEKMSFPGGNSVINGGAVAAAGTDMQRPKASRTRPTSSTQTSSRPAAVLLIRNSPATSPMNPSKTSTGCATRSASSSRP